MYFNASSHTNSRAEDTSRRLTREDPPAWPPAAASSVSTPDATTSVGPFSRPVVVMLGLFRACGCQVSAVMVEGDSRVFLDVITRSGSRTTPLGVVTGIGADQPHADIDSAQRDWAGLPEIRWLLAREAARLYRTYLADRVHSVYRPRPSARPGVAPPSANDAGTDAGASWQVG